MTYALIIMLLYGAGGGSPAVSSVPFATREACEAALPQVRAAWLAGWADPRPWSVRLVCVATGVGS